MIKKIGDICLTAGLACIALSVVVSVSKLFGISSALVFFGILIACVILGFVVLNFKDKEL